MIRKILLLLLAALVIIQFFHPGKNMSPGDQANAISKAYTVPETTAGILKKACLDCHSNNTVYPWYNKVQPIAWWLDHHIQDGKKELNFDEFLTYGLRRQYHKLEEVVEQVKKGEMPLDSYTWVHKDAVLSDAEKEDLINWAEGIRTIMKTRYPTDSLERPRPGTNQRPG